MSIKTYELNNIPERDKQILRQHEDKAQYIKELPKILSDHKNQYDMYFATFTFTNIKSNIDYNLYHEFFSYFRQRLDNALLSNAKAHKKRPFFYLFPEANPQVHFHGILFTHKLTSDRFQNKCVSNIKSEYSEKLAEDVSSIRLKNSFINPYPKDITEINEQSKVIRQKRFNERSAHQKKMLHINKKILTVADYRIYPITSVEQQSRSASYSVKRFIPSRFTTDDIIIEAKEKS